MVLKLSAALKAICCCFYPRARVSFPLFGPRCWTSTVVFGLMWVATVEEADRGMWEVMNRHVAGEQSAH